jgi:hypothetical protein
MQAMQGVIYILHTTITIPVPVGMITLITATQILPSIIVILAIVGTEVVQIAVGGSRGRGRELSESFDSLAAASQQHVKAAGLLFHQLDLNKRIQEQFEQQF